MRHLILIPTLLLFGFVHSLLAKTISLRGYVTAVHSPVSFEMDNYKITDDTEEERQRLEIKTGAKDYRVPQLKPGTLRVGLEVEVKGDYDSNTGEVRATGIKAIYDDLAPGTIIESMGLVEDKSALQKNGQAWSGRFTADGETIVVAPDTLISVKRTRAERKEMRTAGLETDQSVFSPDDIDLDTFAYYAGARQVDHTILAKTIEFREDRAALESGWNTMEPEVDYPDPKSTFGTVTVYDKHYELYPSPQALEYLNKLGGSLIPAHQRDLPEKSPGKVRFRFFLARANAVSVLTYPNGVIIVSAGLFNALHSEGQLAFVLAHEMAKVIEKQDWTTYKTHQAESIGITGASYAAGGALLGGVLADKLIAHQAARVCHDQADRVGIEYMIAAGYDPNQSVEAWRVLEEKHAKGSFWGDRETNFERRTYLETQLHFDYANRDFSAQKHDSADFHRAVEQIAAARKRGKVQRVSGEESDSAK